MPETRPGQSWEMHRTTRTGDDRYWVIVKGPCGPWGDRVYLRCVGTDETKRVLLSTLLGNYTLHYDPAQEGE